MSTTDHLLPEDFPLLAYGQFVYRRTSSSPIIGPVGMELAADLAARLNRDHSAENIRESRVQRRSAEVGVDYLGPSRDERHADWVQLSSRPLQAGSSGQAIEVDKGKTR